MMEENKNIFVIVQVILAIIKKTFIKVSDIAIFLNGIYGTTTITEAKINQMLVECGYQVPKYDFRTSDDVLGDDYIAPTQYYIPTKKVTDTYQVEVSQNDMRYLVWRADILIQILRIDPLKNIDRLTSLFLATSIVYDLVDEDKEIISVETLKSNIQVLQEMLRCGNNTTGGNYARNK